MTSSSESITPLAERDLHPMLALHHAWIDGGEKEGTGKRLLLERVSLDKPASKVLWDWAKQEKAKSRRIRVLRSRCHVWQGVGCTDSDFRGTSFIPNGTMGGSTFDRCDLRGCDWRGVHFGETSVNGARLRGPGLYGPGKADTTEVKGGDLAHYHHGDGPLGKLDRVVSWARISRVGNWPLLGVSNTALALMILWGSLLAAVERAAANLPESLAWVEDWAGVIGHSLWFALLGLALLVLSIAAMIYRGVAPEIVQEYTESQWTLDRQLSLVEYRAASYSFPWLRRLCATGYGLGLGYITIYAMVRFYIAFLALVT